MSLIACESLKAVHILHLEGCILYILNPRDIYRLRPYSIYMSLIILDSAVFDNHICFLRKASPPRAPQTDFCCTASGSRLSDNMCVFMAGLRTIPELGRLQQRFSILLFSQALRQYVCKHFLRWVQFQKREHVLPFEDGLIGKCWYQQKNKISVKLHLQPADSHTINFLCVWPFVVIVDGDVESNPRKLGNNQTFQILLLLTLFCMC